MMAVSPFDGANRIRFKGSPDIADCQFPIADLKNYQSAIGNWNLAIFTDSQPFGSPENFLLVNVQIDCRTTQMQSPKSNVQSPMSVPFGQYHRHCGWRSKRALSGFFRTLDFGHWTLDYLWAV